MPEVKKVVRRPPGRRAKTPTKKGQTTGSILDTAEDVTLPEGLKINLYGVSGSGKTTVWATFPKRILCILISGSSKPGELKSLTAEQRSQTKVLKPKSVCQVHEIAQAVRDYGTFETVVVDHISGLQDLAVCEVGKLEQAPTQGSWGLLEQQQWGQVAVQTKEALRALLSLEQNVVLIAQERVFNADSSDPMIRPFVASALTPSTVGWLNPAVDYICQTFLQPKTIEEKIVGLDNVVKKTLPEMEYCLRVAPHNVFASKFRTPLGGKPRPQYIVDPTYDKIIELIDG